MACSCVDEWLLTTPDLQQAHWSEFRTGSIRTIYHLACAGYFTTNIRLWHYISEMSATISHINPAVKFNKVRYKHNHITQSLVRGKLFLSWGGPGEQRPVIRSTAHNLLLLPAQWRCAVVKKWRPPRSLSQQSSLVKYPYFIGIYWSYMVSGAVFSDVTISKIVDECLEIRSDIGTGVFKPTIGHWWGTPANVRLSDVFRGHWFRSVAVFGLWPFRIVAISVVAIYVCGRFDHKPTRFVSPLPGRRRN